MHSPLLTSVLALGALQSAVAAKHPPHHGRDELKFGTPESVGMLSKPLVELIGNMTGYTHPADYGEPTDGKVLPIEPGSANIVGHDGTIVSYFAVGKSVLYQDVNGTELPKWKQQKAHQNTIYDMASLTKMYTTIAALRELDSGKLELKKTVKEYVPGYEVNGKGDITLQMLMTHTSGFAPEPKPPLYSDNYDSVEERIEAVIKQKLAAEPGTVYKYSDLNYISLMIVLEKVTGKKLDELIGEYTTALGMKDTFFNRGNVEGPKFPHYRRMAAQEFQIDIQGPTVPKRPQPVRGTVHDENAWSLDGVSGHAGLFSTVADTAILCQMILNSGTYGGKRILKKKTVDLIFHDFNAEKFPENPHGLGFELNQSYTAGPMANPLAASHTGFTGVTMVIDRASNSFFLHFANRVHPSREWSSNNIARQALGYWVAKSLGREVDFPE